MSDIFSFSRYLYINNKMKEKKSKRVIVRVTEQQLKNLTDLVVAEQITISEFLRGSIVDKLNKIKEDDQRKK